MINIEREFTNELDNHEDDGRFWAELHKEYPFFFSPLDKSHECSDFLQRMLRDTFGRTIQDDLFML